MSQATILINQKNNLPILTLKSRIYKGNEIQKENLRIFDKISNAKSTIPSQNVLKKQFENHLQMRDKISAY